MGQNWLDDDARWIFSGGGFGGEHYNKYFANGDTLYEGEICKKIFLEEALVGIDSPVPGAVVDTHTTRQARYYGLLCEQNDSVFFKTSFGELKLIFNFNLNTGDSIGLPIDGCEMDSVFLKLVQVDTVVFDSLSLRKQQFQINGSWEGLDGDTLSILEKVGLIDNIWAFDPFGYGILSCITGNPDYQFNCYYNSEFEYTVGDNCQVQFESITAIESLDIPNFKVYPNPTRNMLFLDNLPDDLTSIKVFDAAGKLQIETLNSRIDTRTWAEGMYYVQCTTLTTSWTNKIIVLR